MIGKLIGQVIRKTAPKITKLNVYARTIASKGNGQRRAIIKGFGGANLEETSHFNRLTNLNFWNLRPVVTGFASDGKFYAKRISLPQNRARMRFFQNNNNLKMSRHVVHDIPSTRIQVKGFCTHDKNITGSLPTQPVKLPTKDEIFAQERVVVQGFGGNSAKPIYKQMDNTNSKPRTVVKGFGG